MADTFAEFLSSKTIRRRVDQLVWQTDWQLGYMDNYAPRGDGGLERPQTVVDEVFPPASYQSIELLLNKYRGNMAVASLVGPDDPLPNIRGRATVTEERLARLYIGGQHVWSHAEYDMLHKLGVYSGQGPNNQATATALEEHIIGTAAALPTAIDAKHLILMFLMGCHGSLTYTDPLTGVRAGLNLTDTVGAHLPTAPGTLWDNPAATGLTHIENICEAYRSTLGIKPPMVFMHYDELKDLSQQTATRAQIAARMGTDAGLSDDLYIPVSYDPNTYELNEGMLLDAIRDRAGPIRVIVFDAKYSEEDREGNITERFFLPKGFMMFARPGLGEKARLPFKENAWQPGVSVITEEISKHPLQERISGMTSGVPFFADGRYIAAQRVGAAT
jgi:hypothetical protein